MNLIPLADRVILRKIGIEVKSAGGLILSGGEVGENRDIVFGRVLFVGPGKQLDNSGPIPMTVKKGDLVAFNERIPLRQHYKGQYIYVLRESDIVYINKDEDIVEQDYQEIGDIEKEKKFFG